MTQIENYKIIPVGRSKDLTNQTFGDYLVIYRTESLNKNNESAHWLCQCNKCKKYFIKSAYTLLHGTNRCKCEYDLVGKKIGRWTIMYLLEERNARRQKIYHCKCECGNEKDVSAEPLLKGESKSCGCLNRELAAERCRQTRIDITGQRFGKLVALYPVYSAEKDKHTKWHCKCDCGNETDVDLGNLRQGFSQSCGCVNSKQETNIINILSKNNIKYIYQHRFVDFAIKEFDFFINNTYVIEFDGSQHFKYTGTGWDTKEHFDRTRESDLKKNKYCFDNNIPIIRIPYDVQYDINDLKLETTRFLLTPENENEYYETRK